MIHDLKPYPEYKDSGVEWLGRIPAYWGCLPHRALFKEIKDQGHVDEQLLSVTISQGIIRQADLLFIGVVNAVIQARVQQILRDAGYKPPVAVELSWYYEARRRS